jgi:hypothetical protein
MTKDGHQQVGGSREYDQIYQPHSRSFFFGDALGKMPKTGSMAPNGFLHQPLRKKDCPGILGIGGVPCMVPHVCIVSQSCEGRIGTFVVVPLE